MAKDRYVLKSEFDTLIERLGAVLPRGSVFSLCMSNDSFNRCLSVDLQRKHFNERISELKKEHLLDKMVLNATIKDNREKADHIIDNLKLRITVLEQKLEGDK